MQSLPVRMGMRAERFQHVSVCRCPVFNVGFVRCSRLVTFQMSELHWNGRMSRGAKCAILRILPASERGRCFLAAMADVRSKPARLLLGFGVVGLAHATRPAIRALSKALPRR